MALCICICKVLLVPRLSVPSSEAASDQFRSRLAAFGQLLLSSWRDRPAQSERSGVQTSSRGLYSESGAAGGPLRCVV